jgi:Acetyltransferase (GNAT) domain
MSTQIAAEPLAVQRRRATVPLEVQPVPAGFQFLPASQLHHDLVRCIAAFLDSQDVAHPFQFPQWQNASPGARVALLWKQGRLCWFACCSVLFPFGRRAASVRALILHRGPVCDDQELWALGIAKLTEQARREGFTYLEISPEATRLQDLETEVKRWRIAARRRSSLRLGLGATEESLLAQFRKTTRYEIARAMRRGLEVASAKTDADISQFLDLHQRMAAEKHFRADSAEHIGSVLRWIAAEPTRGVLLLARRENRVEGGIVIVRVGKRCWYVWGATEKRKDFSAGHLLQWRGLLWGKAQGCTEYDFGGLNEEATSGPAWFKRGFGGEVVRFVPPRRRILKPLVYRLMRAAGRP